VLGCDIAHVGGCAITLKEVVDWNHSLGGPNQLQRRLQQPHSPCGRVRRLGRHLHLAGLRGKCDARNNVVSHNLVHDTPRQGITFNGFRNVVEYNHVHHTNQEAVRTPARSGWGLADVYERGSIIRHNYVHDTGGYNMVRPGVWEYPIIAGGSTSNDYTSAGCTCTGTSFARRRHLGGVMVHGGQDNSSRTTSSWDGFFFNRFNTRR